MSVLLVDEKVFEAVYDKIIQYTNNKVVNVNYCNALGGMTEKEAKKFVCDLLLLNVASFHAKYYDAEAFKNPANVLKLNRKVGTISSVQMLKYLQCIRYNVEVSAICYKFPADITSSMPVDSLRILKNAIQEISQRLIEEFTDYRDCKWSEYEEIVLG